jgi:hypothetical protein
VSLNLCASALSAAEPKKAAPVTYDQHVLPLLKDKCIGCHNQDKKRGGLTLNNYLKLMEGGSSGACVKPGDPDNSLLFRLASHSQEPVMPPRSAKLPAESLELIRKWIAAGAPESAGSKVHVAPKSKVDFTLAKVVKGRPAGPPPMPPATLRLEPVVRAARGTAVTALAASPWAPLVAVGGQKQVVLYHNDTLDLLGVLPFPEGVPQVLKFSRNGSLLLAGGGRGGKSGRVVVWSVKSAERLFEVGEESDSILAADVSPDQTRVALGGPGKVVRVYSTRDGKLLNEIRKHTDWVTTLEFSPDGVLLASGDRNGGLFVWEAFTAREYFGLRGHSAGITEVSWRADSNVLASGSEDGTVRLWEMENGNQVRGWGAHSGGTQSVRFTHDGQLVSCGRDRATRSWNGSGGAVRAFENLTDLALRTTFSYDSKRVIAGDLAGQVFVWNAADAKRVGQLTANPPRVKEQLALAQKDLATRQKLCDALVGVAAAGKVAAQKAAGDLAAAQKAVGDTAAAVKTARAKLTQAQGSAATARKALADAEAEVRAKTVLSQALAEAAGKVKAAADRARDDKALAAAAARSRTLADQVAAELALARKSVTQLSAAAGTLATAEGVARQEATRATAAAANAPRQIAPLTAALKAAQAKEAADRAAAEKAAKELAAARASAARWQAALALAADGRK